MLFPTAMKQAYRSKVSKGSGSCKTGTNTLRRYSHGCLMRYFNNHGNIYAIFFQWPREVEVLLEIFLVHPFSKPVSCCTQGHRGQLVPIPDVMGKGRVYLHHLATD